MKERQKRLKSVETQLLSIYEDLFGSEFTDDGYIGEGTEFQLAIQKFKQKHFYIRQLQREREKKQSKRQEIKVSEKLQVGEKIRQEIKKCERHLKYAEERIKNDLKNEKDNKVEKIFQARVKVLNECQQMLANINREEYGDTYQTKKSKQTKKQYLNLQQFKKKRKDDEELNDQINFEEQEALEKFNRKDKAIDDIITIIRNVDTQVKKQLIGTNDAIAITKKMIDKNTQKVDKVHNKIQKGTNDLRQVLKHYRRPSKLCLDVLLVFLLLALVGVIINMVKTSA